MKENVVAEKSYAFALRMVKLYKHLSLEKKEFILSKQVLRSGTSVGANIEEAIAASSKADFINKLNIAAKETRETIYWLRLLKDSDFITKSSFGSVHQDAVELKKILSSILLTTKSTHNS
ncbi:MAG: four helix bundle protein [Hymenobacteraceae bacterium]|nr:four helix bundle protein [Hymenobacteraceae bacterium]